MEDARSVARGAVAQRVADLYEALAADDAEWVPLLVAHDPDALIIGSDGKEWWHGYDRIARGWDAAKRANGGTRLESGELVVWSRDSVAWAADEVSFSLASGVRGTLRLTMVFVEDGESLDLVHLHASAPVPNTEL
jgi:hypothetical protein